MRRADFSLRLEPERLARLQVRLKELLDELTAEGPSTADDAVDVTLFTLLYGLRPGTES
ncbi:hypothetical protein ACIG0C_32225 [Kitasatospora aureofaciens]|uniref:Uncharacterized protein n=1 Tax=Kitasatospora aureofaciens TaxID=1894 RepID=A0A8H9HSU7_KITAU|nr:hypothetical protein [Kitasatospora aureofaciens]UKZ07471.1 hypothetical protein BOQ63_026230 [Streptomyces viridifaciens]GGU86285.1 hypothetical protein GCM10010502_43070 [Kitasatospora aureofaciens]